MIAIHLNNLIFEGKHGCNAREKDMPQRFRVGVTLELADDRAGTTDSLADTLNWSAIKNTIQTLVEQRSFHLLEKLATEICDALLAEKLVSSVTASVYKLDIWGGENKGYPGVKVSKAKKL